MTNSTPKVIAFLSGKGGSGKTTVTIANAKLLADIGRPCLLIDFDLATNGGSYFFKTKFEKKAKGIWECLFPKKTDVRESTQLTDNIIKITKNFDFLPSRTNLQSKGESYDSFSYNVELLREKILKPLIEFGTQNKYEYILIDCQAGYSITSVAASEVAGLAIIVTEADSVSNDAADNLLIQLGDSLTQERRFLVNKIDVRDADAYRNMRNVFQSLNRLPPLPFDFEVRNAFGARQIPVDVNKPSALLFALFETMKYMYTEIFQDIDSYKREHVDSLFQKYDKEMDELLQKKGDLEERQAEIKSYELRYRYNLVQRLLYFAGSITGIISLTYVFARLLNPSVWQKISDFLLPITLGLFGVFVAAYILLVFRKQIRYRLMAEEEERHLSQKLESINRELDQYRSLLWSQSREFLIDSEVAAKTEMSKRGTN